MLFSLIKHINLRESCTLSNQKLGNILLTLHIFSLKFKYRISLEGAWGGVVIKALRYKSEGPVIDSRSRR